MAIKNGTIHIIRLRINTSMLDISRGRARNRTVANALKRQRWNVVFRRG